MEAFGSHTWLYVFQRQNERKKDNEYVMGATVRGFVIFSSETARAKVLPRSRGFHLKLRNTADSMFVQRPKNELADAQSAKEQDTDDGFEDLVDC